MPVFFLFLIGLIVGSFLNVVILRLRSGESIALGRSKCPHCRHALSAADLVPVFSYIFLRGRCRYCQAEISWQYPMIELAAALLFAAVGWLDGGWLMILRNLIAVSALIVIFVYDLRWREIPDAVSLPSIASILLLNWLINPLSMSFAIAAVIGGGFFAVQYYFSDGKWVGGGDIRLGALMGALLGWPSIVAALFLAYVVGAAVGTYLIWRKKAGRKTAMPFGIFLAPAAIAALFWGQKIIDWYLGFM